jgi:ABC-type branched-subunit amino acid transport system ATPase component/ABC-type branched-subunit amino acid transport system permease subunit
MSVASGISRRVPAGALIAGALLLPLLVTNAYQRDLLDRIGTLSVLGMSYNLIIGTAGQVSLSHSAFYAIGGYATAIAITHWGLPQGLAILLSLLACALAALIVGVPTLRLTGFYLAVATLAMTIVLQVVLFQWRSITGGPDGIGGYPAFHLAGWTLRGVPYSYLVVACAIGTYWFLENILRSPLGRAIAAVRDHEAAASALGIPAATQKILALVVSAVLAGIAGNLYAFRDLYLNPVTFGVDMAFLLFFVVVIGGLGSNAGAVVGVIVVTLLPELLSGVGSEIYFLIYGVAMILIIIYLPDGLAGIPSVLRKSGNPALPSHTAQAPLPAAQRPVGGRPAPREDPRRVRPSMPAGHILAVGTTGGTPGDAILKVHGVTKRFGGITALSGATFSVRRRSITALVGPNGAGKTTLFNVVSGVTKPDSGEIHFDGRPVVGLSPCEIARQGLIRTYQSVALFSKMTVYENLLAGYHRRHGAGVLSTALRLPQFTREEARARQVGDALLELFGLTPWRDTLASALPFGLQRSVETARAMAADPKLLLLDEPAAGLNPGEIESLKMVLQWLRRQGVTVLLIEHNLPLVLGISDWVVVLNFGRVLAQGTPEEIHKDPQVIAAYVGVSDREA